MDFLNNYFKYENGLSIGGLTKELNCFYVLNLFKKNGNVIIVANSLYEANNYYNILQNYEENILLFPMDDFLTSVIVAESPELRITRLETLKKIKNSKNIVITNLMGYLKFLSDKNENTELKLKENLDIKRENLVKNLEHYGYKRESIVTSTGEYAVRGFIVDIFPINEENPIRIELFGDNVESIRYFDESNQLSMENITEITISSIKEISSEKNNSLLDYMENCSVIFIDYDQIKAAYNKLSADIFAYTTSKNITNKLMYELEDLHPKYVTYLNNLINSKEKNYINYNSKTIVNYNLDFEKLVIDINNYKKQGYEVIFALNYEKQIIQIRNLNLGVKIIKYKLNNGFVFDKFVVIGENDLENTHSISEKYKSNFKFGKRIKDFNQLEIGDYVVHVSHGIGIYNGLVSLKQNGILKDYIQILYEGNDKIYVPVEKITTIYKYGDKDGTKPKVNKLNSSSWIKTKRYITSKIKDISEELIKLYKERISIKNDPYIVYPEQDVFDNNFEYKLTRDQEKSIKDIFGDLTSNHPMDRLLCGDVGFGKTEVALRAMFNAVLNNKQVMYLCPTTILSKQQYEVALKRFSNWPIEIAVLNRFVSTKDVNRILNNLQNGKIDIVFGTHRLLSSDVKFKKLGLLIVDEEQRFGVTHKEKIKELKKDVNVLTLSATPIPRTLKMALSGIRDLSIIDTHPVNRYPIQTYVILEDQMLIKDAIYKELSRDGQVFILFNNVENIQKKVFEIQQLVPEAKINFAHGKMKKEQLEEIMNGFILRKFDILVCTTIIESGIDIPNVNTLIVFDADYFGLSQLYQIRGRVGRSNKIAYCYLLYKPNKLLNETAVKRLNAIKEFTELGSGYKIAMRDLSIRGAGDIFGSSQAGFVDSVGISLYLKLIDDEIKRQKGEKIEVEEEDSKSLINVETHISDDYVSDEDVKIEIHQRINEINSLDTFNEVKHELEDRFGKISAQIETYMYEEWFESLAKKYNITKVTQNERLVEIEFPEDLSNKVEGDKLLMNAFQLSHNFSLKYERKRIIVTLYIKNLTENFVVYLVKLLNRLEFK